MEGLNLAASLAEMKKLVGGKIDKIQQPQKDVVVLHVHTQGGNYRLLLCAVPDSARVQLTEQKYENPYDAPNFCMLLRKRISGGRILSMTQPNSDRLLFIELEARNELGDNDNFTLIAELMGRYSNIIFADAEGRIIDCTRRVGADMSSVRRIAPGAIYAMPPKQDKKDPMEASKADFENALSNGGKLSSALVDSFYGLSPDMAKHLVSNVTDKLLCDELSKDERTKTAGFIYSFYCSLKAGDIKPHLLLDENMSAKKIYPFPISGYNFKAVESMQAGLDELYASKDIRLKMDRMSASYRKIIKNNIERCERKAALFRETLRTAEETERLRICGELLTANLHAVKAGMKSIEVADYYSDPPKSVVIPLDESVSPSANAQRYYKQYRKAKIAYDMAEERMRETEEELLYLEGVLLYLENVSNTSEMLDIRDELLKEGYIKEHTQGKKNKTQQKTQPLSYISESGVQIYVGKNNKQNDELTFKTANSDDVWLHVKNAPGSHVIIKSAEPDRQTLYEAAMLAAYYSSQRRGVSVAVDYTQRKNVKKQPHAKPGMVFYVKYSTAYVTPDEAFIKNLKTGK